MNVNSSPINHGSTGYTTALNRSRLIRLRNWNCSVRGRWPKDVIICTVNYGVGSVTQPRRVLRHSIQNWLHVSRRAGDDTQNLTCCRLVLQRLLKFLKQTHVLDGNDRLVGEGFENFDLRIREWS